MNKRFETFTVLINRISRNIRRMKNQEMAAYGLRSAHVSCLYYLYLAGSLTATELCERCDEDKATISRALDFLERQGYLTGASGKRYRSPLTLTNTGRDIGRQVVDKINAVLDQVSDGLTEAERLELYRCLAIVSRSLDSAANTKEEQA